MDELLNRAVENVYPSREALAARLKDGKPLTIYYGIDPTGPDVHLGHAVPLWKLRDFQNLGHKIILLIGDFTAMIGDPTDKTAERIKLSREQVIDNCQTYLKQIEKILDLSKTEVRHNSEWLSKLSFSETLNLYSKVTYNQIIKRNMFQKRLEQDKDIFFSEFMYPVMQGYDSVALDVDMEIGGNDQTFNMLVGRDLMKKLKGKEKFVLATKLLAAPGETKMSKSEGNMVTLTDTPGAMFGKIMSWPDEILPLAYELCTPLEKTVYEPLLAGHPREAKIKLAKEVVTLYHGAEAASEAEQEFEKIFSSGEFPADTLVVKVIVGTLLSQILLDNKLVESKSDFERLINQGAVKDESNNKITDRNFAVAQDLKLRVGKHRFVKIVIH